MTIDDLVKMLNRHAYTFDVSREIEKYRSFARQKDDTFDVIGYKFNGCGDISPMVAKFREHTEPGNEYFLGDLSDVDSYSQDLIVRYALQDIYGKIKETKYNILTGEIHVDDYIQYSSYKKVKVNGLPSYKLSVCSSDELRQPEYQFTEDEIQELLKIVPDKERRIQIEMGLKVIK